MSHACPDLIAQAVYGLPEINRAEIRQARLVANLAVILLQCS